MAIIKCNVTSCKYYNNNRCMSSEIDVGKRDAVNKLDTMCETYRKKQRENYVTEFGLLNCYCEHEVSCDAKNCKYNEGCICKKDIIKIEEENKNKICESFKLEKC